MRNFYSIYLLILLLSLSSCATYKDTDNRWAMNANVCKKLRGDVLVYAVFVDIKELPNWEQKDVNRTIDSLKIAMDWIKEKATKEEIPLNFRFEYFKKQQTIDKNFPEKLSNALYNINNGLGLDKINKWSDNVSKLVGNMYDTKVWTDSFPHVTKPNNTERLIALLRDEYHTENVVLFFMLNGERSKQISVSMNRASNENIEYEINSFNYASIFAFEILNLFGAANLYTPEVSGKGKSKTYAQYSIPNDVMVNPFSSLTELEISGFTQYMIGWNSEVKDGYEKLFRNRKYKK